MERFSCVTVHSTTIFSRWVFADIPALIMRGSNNGSTSTALTNQVTIHFTLRASASCCNTIPALSSACIMSLCCWSRWEEECLHHCRITVGRQSAAKRLSKELVNFRCLILWSSFWGSFITKFLWRGLRKRELKHQRQRKDWVLFFIGTSFTFICNYFDDWLTSDLCLVFHT